jgi:hypothetical protein
MRNLNPTTKQRQWVHKAHTTHDKDKHNKAKKTKEMNILNPTTNQRQLEHKTHTTHDKDKHNKPQKTKEMRNLNPTTNQTQWNIMHTQHRTKTNTTKHRKLKR